MTYSRKKDLQSKTKNEIYEEITYLFVRRLAAVELRTL